MIPLSDVRLFLFDLDGTLYLGNQLFPFTQELLAAIRAAGKRYLFMTNNSSKSVADYVKKLGRLGIAVCEDDFITSAQATAHYLREHYPTERFYVGGTRSLLHEFADAGLSVTDRREDGVSAVVVGFDTELTFAKLEDLSFLLRRDIPYIATHPDLVCPTEYGLVPDCGAVCEMLFYATGRRPLVIGKPEPLMPRLAMERLGVSPAETMVVGDRLHTDIACGLRAEAHTLLVFSGESTPKTLAASPLQPEDTAPDAGALLSALRSLS